MEQLNANGIRCGNFAASDTSDLIEHSQPMSYRNKTLTNKTIKN